MQIQSSMGSAERFGREIEHYWDIDQPAAFLGVSRAELWERAERGSVPAHKLRHEGKYCWKFKPTELLEIKGNVTHDPDKFVQ